MINELWPLPGDLVKRGCGALWFESDPGRQLKGGEIGIVLFREERERFEHVYIFWFPTGIQCWYSMWTGSLLSPL